jgi:gliding motility-associated-like protein
VSNPNIPNPLFAGTANQTITLSATNGTCTADSSFAVTLKSLPTVTTIPDSTLCGTQAIVLTTTGAQTYSWSPAFGLSNPNISNPTFTGNTNSSYTVTGTATNGCSSTDVINITLAAPPIVSSFADTSVCDNITLNLNATGANTYSWSPATSVSNPNIANPVFTGTSGSQTLTVTGSNSPGCSSSVSFTITVNPSPMVSTIPDSSICNNQTIFLTTTGAQTYSWSPATNLSNPNIGNPTFTGLTGNTYTVTGIAANGCRNTDIVMISVTAPSNFVAPPNADVCINKTVSLDGNNGNNVNYQWSPITGLSNSNTINPTYTPTTVGTKTFTLLMSENICNSSASFTVNVEVNRLPTVNVSSSNDIDCANTISQLNASGASSYLWTPSNTLNNASIASPIASPTINTSYNVVGFDSNGCENSAAVEVKVSDKEGGYYVPNAFTPNGDGLNDCFGVKQWGNVADLYFIIYNRWGEKVFETRNINICWDGQQKGSPADPGNYVYYIQSKSPCGDQVRKGNVLLIR